MEIVIAIGSKLGEYLVEPSIQQARYLFCFNSVVEDLNNKEEQLKWEQVRIKEEVEREERNTKEIEVDVAKWLKDVDNVMTDVQRLKDEIQVKKSCLNGWCPNWGCHYWLGKEVTKKTIIMSKLIEKRGKFNTVAHLKPLPGMEFSIPRNFMSFKATEMACDHLIKALTNEKTKLVGLYGTGGAGKTTLAKVTGVKLQQQKIFDEILIVAVSQYPNFINIQNQLAVSLGLELKEVDKEDRAKRLYLRFTETTSKVFVILDDVWQRFDLKTELGIPVDDNHKGCKILLTTRRRTVCDQMGCDPSIQLGILEQEEGLVLLKKYAGIDDDDSKLIGVSKKVAAKCKGLPLAIGAVGSALREKYVDEWKRAYRKLKNAKLIDIDDIDRDVYACLELSYDYLKDEEAKLCFMLCSLFPEDDEISLEDLVRYGVGWGLYRDVNTIEEARSLMRGTIKGLKDSSLLLDAADEGFVKMHDIVRDVAIWIGSKGKTFMSKAGTGLTEWPEDEDLAQYRAISLVRNEIKKLPQGFVCPNLHILLLGGFYDSRLAVPDQFFEGMRTLKIVTIINGELSLKSLQYSPNLRVLQLIFCHVRDMAFLGKLERLQILSLKNSFCGEIPEELGELGELKLLDIGFLSPNRCISLSIIRRFSRLQEFDGLIKHLEVEEISSERSYENVECLPECFTFSKLQRYNIHMGLDSGKSLKEPLKPKSSKEGPTTKSLTIENIKATKLVIFSALYQNLQRLALTKVIGCQNIVPSIDQEGLNALTSLLITACKDLECILDTSQHAKSQNLGMFSSLARLILVNLPDLQWICKAPAQHVSLQSLKVLEVTECHSLTHLFSLSQARSLLQLENLEVYRCDKLKSVIEANLDGNGREEHLLGEDEITIVLPMLRKLRLEELPILISFCSENYHSTWQALQELKLHGCPMLTVNDELKASERYLVEELQILHVQDCDNARDAIFALVKHDLKNLKELVNR